MVSSDSAHADRDGDVLLRSRWHPLADVAVGVLISYAPVMYGFLVIVRGGRSQNDLWYCLLLPCLSFVLMMGYVAIRWRYSANHLTPGLRWIDGTIRWEVVRGVGLGIAAITAAVVVARVIAKLNVPRSNRILFDVEWWSGLFLVLYVMRFALLTPLVEEIFWRGHIQSRLQEVLGPRVGVVLQAVMFALVHLYGTMDTVTVFIFGLTAGIWRSRKQTLLPVVVGHVVWNSISLIPFVYTYGQVRAERTQSVAQKYGAALQEMCLQAVSEGGATPKNNEVADHYQRATELLGDQRQQLDRSVLSAWPADLGEAEVRRVRTWIRSNQPAIREFEIGAQGAWYVRDYTKIPFADIVSCPSWPRENEIVSMLLSRAKLAACEGTLKGVLADVITCWQFGRQLMGPKPLNEQSFGLAVQHRCLVAVFQILARASLDDSALAALQGTLVSMFSGDAYTVTYSGERCVLLYIIESTLSSGIGPHARLSRASLRTLLQDPACAAYGRKAWEEIDREGTMKSAEELFTYLDSIREYTPWELHRTGRFLQNTVGQIAGTNPLLLRQTTGYERYYNRFHQCQALKEGLMVTIAAMRYQRHHGHVPDTLAELVRRGYLNALPSDPFGDSSLVYRPVGQGFMLYSVGPDFKDDGGNRPSLAGEAFDGDDVFWPADDEGVHPSQAAGER